MPTTVAISAGVGAVVGANAGLFGLGLYGSIIAGATLYGGLAAANYLLQKSLAPSTDLTRGADLTRTVRDEVSPARWVLGRARVGGDLVYISDAVGEARYIGDAYDDGANFLRLILVLSEGPVDAVEKVWIDGVEEHFVRADRVSPFAPAPRNPNGNVLVPNRPADAGEDSRFNDDARNSNGQPLDAYRIELFLDGAGTHNLTLTKPAWTPGVHKLEGKAFVFVELRDYKWDKSGNLQEHRFNENRWPGIPNLEFLVRGIKYTRPSSATADVTAWSSNGVDAYHWFLTERLGVPAAKINRTSFLASRLIAGQTVTVTLPDETGYEDYPTTISRYDVNGVVISEDSSSRVLAELDFAIGGGLVEPGGIVHIRAGVDRPLGRAITDDDLVRLEGWEPGPDLQERVNTVAMKLDQGAEVEWTRMAIPEYSDTAAVARDGVSLVANLGTRAVVAEPAAALRLAAIALRRARYHGTYRLRLRPGAGFVNHSLLPGDRHPLTVEHIGLDAVPCEVQAIALNEDLTVSVTFRHSPDGIHADTAVLPPKLPPSHLRAAAPPVAPGSISWLLATGHAYLLSNGVKSSLSVSWLPALPASIHVTGPNDFSVRIVSDASRQNANGSGNELIEVPGTGLYTITARLYYAGEVGPSRIVTATVSWASIVPPLHADFAVTSGASIRNDGSVLSWINVGFPESQSYDSEVAARQDDFSVTRIVSPVLPLTDPPRDRQVALDVRAPGAYEVRARYAAALLGPWRTKNVTVSWAHLAPTYRLETLLVAQYGSILQVICRPITDPGFAGAEFRYVVAALDSTAAIPTISTEEQWKAAPILGVVSSTPSLRGRNAFFVLSIPVGGRYRIYARAENRAGLQGPISYLGYHALSQVDEGAGTFAFGPLWQGVLRWVAPYPEAGPRHPLVVDQDPTPDTAATYNTDTPPKLTGGTVMTRRRWNGQDGWPFGPFVLPASSFTATKPYYYGPEVDLGKVAAAVQVRLIITAFAPTGTPTAQIRRRVNATIHARQTASGDYTSHQISDTGGNLVDVELGYDYGQVDLAGDSRWTVLVPISNARYLRPYVVLEDWNNVGISQIALDYRITA